MNCVNLNYLSDSEHEIVIICLEIMQKNVTAFTEHLDRAVISALLPSAHSKLQLKSDITNAEFTVILHSIEYCFKALHNIEPINPSDLKKIKPYKKSITLLYKTYKKLYSL